MKKTTMSLVMAAMLLPASVNAQRIQQKLERSVVAVTGNGSQNVLVSWRKLAQEPENCTYNLYRRSKGATEYTKVNTSPITTTNFQTTFSAIPYNSELAVTIVANGVESEKSRPFLFKQQTWGNVFFDFNFETTVLNPNDYRCKYAWPMDLDGNGVIDAVLADRRSNVAGVSHKLQAYRLDGTCLWTIDMGINVDITAGQNDMVTVYDINCDGRCEVIIRSSDGTRFWDVAANTWGKYANGSAVADTDGDGIENYRTQSKRNPPYYVSVVDGLTGAEIDCGELKYSELKDNSDKYGRDNRADYYDDNEGTEYAFLQSKFVICYFDGVHPSLAVEAYNRRKSDGHHYYMLSWEYDWNGGHASNWHHEFSWSRNIQKPHAAEFHQLRVADTDGDGIDEMLEGGFGANPVKGLVYSAGIEHGDRYDVSDIDPDRPGMEVFAIQQSSLLGQVLYDARTGEHIKEWYLPSVYDVGRGRCIDVDPSHKGYEIFSLLPNLYDCKGEVISEGNTTYPYEAIWWDGDLQREQLASPGGSGYASNLMVAKYNGSRLIEFSKQSDWAVHAGWAVRPAFMGDITGDWREEVILMKQNDDSSTGLVGYTTDIPTDYSLYTLMEDQHYRLDCTGRGYYQMPCTSFYLGGDMPYPSLPATMVTDLRWNNGASWSKGGTGFTSFDQSSAQSYTDGKSVIFDLSGAYSAPINLTGTLQPKAVYFMNPNGCDYTFNAASGSLAGDMNLYKSMEGIVTYNGNLAYTGTTEISEGKLFVNGHIAGPVNLRAKGTLGGNVTVDGAMTFEGALNYEGCRLMPSGTDGVITFSHDLIIPGNIYIEVDAADGKCGSIKVNGNLTFNGENTFTINQTDIAAGEYVLAECTGGLTANAENIKVRGLDGVNYTLSVEQKRIVLSVATTRKPMKDVTWTGSENGVWDYKSDNFSAGGTPTCFVTGDEVVFGNDSKVRDITVNETMVAGNVTFDVAEGTYTFSGNGSISGTAGLTKNGEGEVRINLKNNDYTGPTIINDGTLTITNMYDGGQKSAIGASTAAEGNLKLNGGTLKLIADNMATDHIITLTDTATINVANAKGSLSLKGRVLGTGYLVKEGPGQLNFTYGGENPFAGIIIRGGTVAQGAWNASFGKTGSPMVLEGGEVDLINMNNSSTRPIFNYKTTVVEGTKNKIKGTTRGAVNGSFLGKGNLTIVSTGVRSDIGADFSAFEGQLTAEGENFRLMDNVTNMMRTDVVMAAGAKMMHTKSNSGTASAVTTKMGSLASAAKDCELGNGQDSYEVGYNGASTTFSGLLKAKTIKKVGEGTWTINNDGSTSAVTVAGGALQLYNSPFSSSPAPFSTGSVVVANGGTLTGLGCAGTVTVSKGGVIAAGYNGGYGTLKATGRVTMQGGSVIVIKVGLNSTGNMTYDKFKFSNTFTHIGDTILIKVDEACTLNAGDELKVFTGTGSIVGNYILKTEYAGHEVVWDDSELLTSGVLRVASITDGISGVHVDGAKVNVYTTDGILVRSGADASKALDGLNSGVYVVGGRKIVKK